MCVSLPARATGAPSHRGCQLSVNESIPLRGLVGHSENLRLVARRQQTGRTTQSRPAVCGLAVYVETLHQRLDRATAAANRIDVDAGDHGQVWNGGPGRSEICVHRRRPHTPTGHAWFLICPKLRCWTFAHTENEPPSPPKRNVAPGSTSREVQRRIEHQRVAVDTGRDDVLTALTLVQTDRTTQRRRAITLTHAPESGPTLQGCGQMLFAMTDSTSAKVLSTSPRTTSTRRVFGRVSSNFMNVSYISPSASIPPERSINTRFLG